jgi:XTP/dITP diphosphohydrolase
MKSYLLASANAHKAEEFKELFGSVLRVTAAPASLEVAETGESFQENAFLKARAYFETYKVPAMADDSGLVIPAMPDVMGVETANFAAEFKDYSQRCQSLLQLMQERQVSDRSAYFVCVLCFYLSADEVYFFEGRVHGHIGESATGDQGFGYDPVFIPERRENDGKSLAQLPEWKNEFSHRAKAVQSAIAFFKESVDKIT